MAGRLRDQGNDIRRLVAGLDEEALAWRPIPGKWSLKESIAHLWRVQEVFESRIEAMLTRTKPALAPYEPEGDPEFAIKLTRTGEDLVNGFLGEREELASLLESLSPADWRHRGIQPEYRHYDVQFAVESMAYHEAHHIYQMLQRRSLAVR
jgi:DinB superfamily